MTSVQPVSQKNEYKRHYIKPTGLIASASLGALYGITTANNCQDPLSKVLYPIDYRLEEAISKKTLGKKLVDFLKKNSSHSEEGMINLTKLYKSEKSINKNTTIYKMDKSMAGKAALLMTGLYIAVKLVKKGIDYLLYDRYRK